MKSNGKLWAKSKATDLMPEVTYVIALRGGGGGGGGGGEVVVLIQLLLKTMEKADHTRAHHERAITFLWVPGSRREVRGVGDGGWGEKWLESK